MPWDLEETGYIKYLQQYTTWLNVCTFRTPLLHLFSRDRFFQTEWRSDDHSDRRAIEEKLMNLNVLFHFCRKLWKILTKIKMDLSVLKNILVSKSCFYLVIIMNRGRFFTPSLKSWCCYCFMVFVSIADNTKTFLLSIWPIKHGMICSHTCHIHIEHGYIHIH